MDRTEQMLLRVVLAENDRVAGQARYEVIVEAARAAGLAGATVLRGPLGFGHSARLHTTRILRLAVDLPMVIDIIDDEASIEAFLQDQTELLRETLVTVNRVERVIFPADADLAP